MVCFFCRFDWLCGFLIGLFEVGIVFWIIFYVYCDVKGEVV